MREKARKYWREGIVFAAAVAVLVLFFTLQDFSGPMVIADRYTPLFLALGVLSGGLFFCVRRRYRAEDKERAAGRMRKEEEAE